MRSPIVRSLVWLVLLLVGSFVAFHAGTSYENRDCFGECDLGMFNGFWWATIWAVSFVGLVVAVELVAFSMRRVGARACR